MKFVVKFVRRAISLLLSVMLLLSLLAPVTADAENQVTVHAYKPFVVPALGQGGVPYPTHVASETLSTRFGNASGYIDVSGTPVAAVQYNAPQGRFMDVARFATDSLTPEITIEVRGGTAIDSVTVHPVRYYPQESLKFTPGERTLTFTMSDKLPYAIVVINGNDPADASGTNPQLTLINDPLEDPAKIPSKTASNVLDFGAFATQYLAENPITDTVGQQARPGGSVTGKSRWDANKATAGLDMDYTWTYPAGNFVEYTDSQVRFPNKRARNKNDLTEALEKALEKIYADPVLDTLYIPAGVYLWSGLKIHNWNHDPVTGAKIGNKRLYVYSEEDALMINRLGETKESNEPGIYIKNSSHITISGRGMHDAQGCLSYITDRKDAANTPHRGGSMQIKTEDIIFHDTYLRDAQQWNWEVHDAKNVTFNNIKGLTPYSHGWLDGLNMAGGQNITVNGAVTLGNDDTFASGHYNPANEFPSRLSRDLGNNEWWNNSDNVASISQANRNIFAAAEIYNADRLEWDTRESRNIRINNTLGWTRTAHCIRVGDSECGIDGDEGPKPNMGYARKSYYFNNFNSVTNRDAGGDIRFQNTGTSTIKSEEIEIKNSSFWTRVSNWAQIPTSADNTHMINKVTLINNWYAKPIANPSTSFSGITNLTVRELYIGGERIQSLSSAGISSDLSRVTNFYHDFDMTTAANLLSIDGPVPDGTYAFTSEMADESAANAELARWINRVDVWTTIGPMDLNIHWAYDAADNSGSAYNPAMGAMNTFTWTIQLDSITNTIPLTVTGKTTVTNFTPSGNSIGAAALVGTNLTINVTAAEPENTVVYLATYDSTDTLIDLRSHSLAAGEYTKSVMFDNFILGNGKTKVFLWTKGTNIPLTASKDVPSS